MEKNKMYLIGGGIAVAGIVAYMLYTSKNTGITSTSTCPAGQVPCSNNKLKCYNPLTTYATDPCATVTAASTDPITQIVSGIIGLFKKNPTTTAASATTPATPYPAIS